MFRIEILILLVKIHVAVSIKLNKINKCDKVKEGYLIALKCSWIDVLQVCFMLGWLSEFVLLHFGKLFVNTSVWIVLVFYMCCLFNCSEDTN